MSRNGAMVSDGEVLEMRVSFGCGRYDIYSFATIY
jgi:hypothetical protein